MSLPDPVSVIGACFSLEGQQGWKETRGGERRSPAPEQGGSGCKERTRGSFPVTQLFPPPRPGPYSLWLPAFFPGRGTSALHLPPSPPAGRTASTFPGLARPGSARQPRAEGARLQKPRREGGARGAGTGRGQSAGEAVAGPRLAGPAGSNLPGLAWSFEPLHPLAAPGLLQPPVPKTRPGRAGVRREGKTQVPPSAHPGAVCARSVRVPSQAIPRTILRAGFRVSLELKPSFPLRSSPPLNSLQIQKVEIQETFPKSKFCAQGKSSIFSLTWCMCSGGGGREMSCFNTQSL